MVLPEHLFGQLSIGMPTDSLTRWQLASLHRRLHRTSKRAYWGAWLGLCRYFEYGSTLDCILRSEARLILDVGGGDSLLAASLIKQGREVVTLDLDTRELLTCKHIAGRDGVLKPGELRRWMAIKADARTRVFAAQSFDLVTCVSTLEHIPADGDSEAIREIARILKPGGQVILTVPFSKTYREAVPPYDDERTHRLYDYAALEKRLVGASGLKVMHVSCFGVRSAVPLVQAMLWVQRQFSHFGLLRMPNALLPAWAFGALRPSRRMAEGAFMVMEK
jgi:SAM-dependent methyltransferase